MFGPLIGLTNLVSLYRARLSARTVLIQEGFAVLGIAVGVALLFASQVASTSLQHSVEQLTHELFGNTQYQIDARSSEGIDERVVESTRRVPGVRFALPVIEHQAVLTGPSGQASVDLIGIDPRLVHATGRLLRRFSARQLAGVHALALPTPLAARIGVGPLEAARVEIGSHVSEDLVGATLGEKDIAGLVNNPVALMPIRHAQRLSGMRGRVTTIFIKATEAANTRTRLRRIATAADANLEPADFDSTLFRVAATPENQGEILFAGISALVGFMFALNAMLVTVPSRRRLIDDLRPQGASRAQLLQVLLFDAAVLAVFSCGLGLALGELLSVVAFHAAPGYLSSAFPIGDDRIVTWQAVALAGGAGVVAACLGVLWPLRDAFSPTAVEPETGDHGRRRSRGARLLAGGLCLGATTAIVLLRPQSALIGSVTLVVALGCLLPLLFRMLGDAFGWVQEKAMGGAVAALAVNELRNPRVQVRALAVAATAAIAVFGAVAVGGTQLNLQQGLRSSASQIDQGADVWIAPSGQASLLTTTAFKGIDTRPLAHVAGVRALGVYRGGFLDWGDHRLWILAPPANTHLAIPPSQLLKGSRRLAEGRLRSGSWAVLSSALASAHHLHLGDSFVLPSPRPVRLSVAAISTNLGWPPGAVILGSQTYARAWASGDPSAYELQLRSGASPSSVVRRLRALLTASPGLSVETTSERQRRHYDLIGQGLSRLTQIKLLVLLAGALAVAGAMGSLILQRRQLIAFMKVDGFRRGVLWRWLLCESAMVLTAGCLIGVAFGLYGQLLNSDALASVTGMPVVLGVEALIALTSFLLMSVVALAVLSVPGYLVVRVPPSTVSPRY